MNFDQIATMVLGAILIAVIIGVVALFRSIGFWRAAVVLAGIAAVIWWGPPGVVYRQTIYREGSLVAISDAKQICTCLFLYRLDHGHLPPNIDAALAEAVEPAEVEQMRLYRRSPDGKRITPTPYLYFPHAGEGPEDLLLAAPFPMELPGNRHRQKRVVAFGNGQVRFESEEKASEWIRRASVEGEVVGE